MKVRLLSVFVLVVSMAALVLSSVLSLSKGSVEGLKGEVEGPKGGPLCRVRRGSRRLNRRPRSLDFDTLCYSISARFGCVAMRRWGG